MFNFVYFKQDHVAVPADLDLVEEEDQITHLLRLEEAGNTEDILSKSDVKFILFGNWLWTFRILALILMFVLMLVLIIITCLYADIFKFDPDFLENEDKYKEIKRGKYSLIILVLLQPSVFV